MSSDTHLAALESLADNTLTPIKVDGHALIVGRNGDEVCVAVNRCPHLGLSLTRGPGGMRYDDGVVECPWHNSRFSVCSGENLDWVSGFAGRSVPRWSRRLMALGSQPQNLTTVPSRIEDGQVYVDLTGR